MKPGSKEIAEARRLLDLVSEPSEPTFNEFAASPSAEIRAILYEKLCDKSPPFLNLAEASVDRFCIDFLITSYTENSHSESEFSRFESAKELVVWCDTLLNEGKQDLVFKLREVFAHWWRQGSADGREELTAYILEHIFQNLRLRVVFETWSTDPELSPAYFTGVEYADQLSAVSIDKQLLQRLWKEMPANPDEARQFILDQAAQYDANHQGEPD